MVASEILSENPAHPDEVVGRFAAATPADVGAALTRATEAQQHWAALSPSRRATLIGGVAHALSRETKALAELITREEGKTLAESRGEVQKSAEQFHFASQLAYQVEGTTFPEEEPDTFTYTLREPLGVVVAITPWNFPLSLPARKIAPALAAGNAVVFKPSPATAAVGAALAQLFQESGLPEGLVEVVQGASPDAMTALVGDPRVAAISFTGSDAVGAALQEGARPGVRLQFELGGHNIAVVCADADLKAAAAAAVRGAVGLSGQACTATDRVLVERAVYPEFCAAVAAEFASISVGEGTTDGVTCGPVATAAQHARLSALAGAAREAGARVLGQAVRGGDVAADGYYVTPAGFADVPEDHPLVRDEIFGPFFTVAPIADVAEGIAAINADAHGLVAAVHTKSLATATRFARLVRCGIVKVNRRTTGNGVAPPFGGWKASSTGSLPESGRQALEFFTETKTVYSGF